MEVFLVPVAADRYELYCEEEPGESAPSDTPPPEGFFRRLVHRFRVMVAEAEDERRRGRPAEAPPRGLLARVKARTMRWVAESIAEQRLLWQLRGRHAAGLVHPDDLPDAHAREILRRQLNRDFERHRFWLAIDSLGLIGSALLMLLPGPNVVAYYFAFRIVGHYLSVRGARNGIVRCQWDLRASPALSRLRAVIPVSPDDRAARVNEVASELQLEHLAAFFQRTATE
jgi:hypothetical protein